MRSASFNRCVVLIATLLAAAGTRLGAAEILQLDDSVRRALASNPEIAVARVRVDRAAAELREARLLLPSDPVIELGQGSDLSFANEGERRCEVGLSQEVEIPGKRSLRKEAAEKELDADRAAVGRDVAFVTPEPPGDTP